MTNKILEFSMLVLGDIKRFFSDLIGGIFKEKYRPYIRDIEIFEGPINIRVIGLQGDANSELMYSMIKDLSVKYPVVVNYIPDMKRKGDYPKIYIDNQPHVIGMLTYEGIDAMIQNVMNKKKKIVERRIKEIKEIQKKTDYFIVYSNPLFKDESTELLVPSEFIIAREKNLRLDVRIRRDGLPNNKPNRDAISSRNQIITDFRNMDGAHPDEILQIGESGIEKVF